jgi:hypothetical protein
MSVAVPQPAGLSCPCCHGSSFTAGCASGSCVSIVSEVNPTRVACRCSCLSTTWPSLGLTTSTQWVAAALLLLLKVQALPGLQPRVAEHDEQELQLHVVKSRPGLHLVMLISCCCCCAVYQQTNSGLIPGAVMKYSVTGCSGQGLTSGCFLHLQQLCCVRASRCSAHSRGCALNALSGPTMALALVIGSLCWSHPPHACSGGPGIHHPG